MIFAASTMFKVLSTFKSLLLGSAPEPEKEQRQQEPEVKNTTKGKVNITNMILKNSQFQTNKNVNTPSISNDLGNSISRTPHIQHNTTDNIPETLGILTPSNKNTKSAFKRPSSSFVKTPFDDKKTVSSNSPWKAKAKESKEHGTSPRIHDSQLPSSKSPWRTKVSASTQESQESQAESTVSQTVHQNAPKVSNSPWKKKATETTKRSVVEVKPETEPAAIPVSVDNYPPKSAEKELPTTSQTPKRILNLDSLTPNKSSQATLPKANQPSSESKKRDINPSKDADANVVLESEKITVGSGGTNSPWKTKGISISKDNTSKSPWKQKPKSSNDPSENVEVSKLLKTPKGNSPWKQSTSSHQKEIIKTVESPSKSSSMSLESLLREAARPSPKSPWATKTKSLPPPQTDLSMQSEPDTSISSEIRPNSTHFEATDETPSKSLVISVNGKKKKPNKGSKKVTKNTPQKSPKRVSPQSETPPIALPDTQRHPHTDTQTNIVEKIVDNDPKSVIEIPQALSPFGRKRKGFQPPTSTKKSKTTPSPVVQTESFETARLPDTSKSSNPPKEPTKTSGSSVKSNIREMNEIGLGQTISSQDLINLTQPRYIHRVPGNIIIPPAIPRPNIGRTVGPPPKTVLPPASSLLKHGSMTLHSGRITIGDLTNPDANEGDKEIVQVINLPQQVNSQLATPVQVQTKYTVSESKSDNEDDVKRYTRRGRAKHKDNALKNNLKNNHINTSENVPHIVRIDPSEEESNDEIEASGIENSTVDSTVNSIASAYLETANPLTSDRRQLKEQRRIERRNRRINLLIESIRETPQLTERTIIQRSAKSVPINSIFVTESDSEDEPILNEASQPPNVTIQSIEENLEQERMKENPSTLQVQQSPHTSVVLVNLSSSEESLVEEHSNIVEEDHMIDSDDTMYSDLGSTESEDTRINSRTLRAGRRVSHGM